MILAINYETWCWQRFRLDDLGEHAVVLTLVNGSCWEKYTRTADVFWWDGDPDGNRLEDYELEEYILNDVGPEECVVIAPNGLMSRKENKNE